MFPSDVEARALALALQQGLLRTPPPQGTSIEALVAEGLLDPSSRDRLLWEALQNDAPPSGEAYPATWTLGAWVEPAPAPGVIDLLRFGPYESLELIGVGGQGRVYRAFDPRLHRHVALKLLHSAHPEAHLREAQAQAQVEHRNVCRVYEVGEVEGQPYIALQLIRGRALSPQTAAPREIVRLLRDAAEGVHAAHRQGLLHLDLKPGNLLVSEEGGAPILYVTDFGLTSDLQQEGDRPLGSPPYCAPEQMDRSRAKLDARADVYGLGATLFVALTGRLPFQADSLTDLMLQIQQRPPLRPSALSPAVPKDLEAILLKAMAKEPDDRYASALAFADDLDRWLKGMPIQARPSSRWNQLGKWSRRNPIASASLALLMLLSAGTAVWAARAAQRRRHMQALLRTFSEDMRTLELRLFAMRMLPPEDQRSIRADLRERLARIEGSLSEMGDLAPAGHYALGIGYRSLREWEPSANHFKAAWDAGFRTPESAEATGIAFGILTQVLTQKLQSMPEGERPQAEREIQTKWGGPGRKLLETYAGTPLEPPYSAAMAAYHHKDFDAVFVHCLESVRRQPWQVAGWRFIVSCTLENPEAAARHGLGPDADGSTLAVRRLAVTGPGDAGSQDVLGEYWARQAAAAPNGSALMHARFMRAFEHFEHARTIDPDQVFPFDRSVELCERAMKAEPSRAAFWRNTREQVWRSAEREPALAKAIQASRAEAIP
jgi:serine/threonine protein kinase